MARGATSIKANVFSPDQSGTVYLAFGTAPDTYDLYELALTGALKDDEDEDTEENEEAQGEKAAKKRIKCVESGRKSDFASVSFK
jgi:hypothetical protein